MISDQRKVKWYNINKDLHLYKVNRNMILSVGNSYHIDYHINQDVQIQVYTQQGKVQTKIF